MSIQQRTTKDGQSQGKLENAPTFDHPQSGFPGLSALSAVASMQTTTKSADVVTFIPDYDSLVSQSARRVSLGSDTNIKDHEEFPLVSSTTTSVDQRQTTISSTIPATSAEEKERDDPAGQVIEYRDHSRTPVDDLRDPSAFIFAAASTKEPPFPVKLHRILCNPEFQDIVSWLPHGRSWRVHKPRAFEEKIIPLHFRHCRYSSFMRQVNGWGFKRVLHGPDVNSYYHELFLRGLPHLSLKMRRVTGIQAALQSEVAKNSTPDFYRISDIFPLPLQYGCHDKSREAASMYNARQSLLADGESGCDNQKKQPIPKTESVAFEGGRGVLKKESASQLATRSKGQSDALLMGGVRNKFSTSTTGVLASTSSNEWEESARRRLLLQQAPLHMLNGLQTKGSMAGPSVVGNGTLDRSLTDLVNQKLWDPKGQGYSRTNRNSNEINHVLGMAARLQQEEQNASVAACAAAAQQLLAGKSQADTAAALARALAAAQHHPQ